MLITKEEVKGNEEVEVAALCYRSEHLCAAARNYLNGHAELATLVVDLECRDPQSQPTLPLGQQQEKEAQLSEEEARDSQLGALDSQPRWKKKVKQVSGRTLFKRYGCPWRKEVDPDRRHMNRPKK
ncbi:hypothetical protein ACSQ67_011542 [Phaseolus vulgaris]